MDADEIVLVQFDLSRWEAIEELLTLQAPHLLDGVEYVREKRSH